jgi:hypothetical protein
MPQPHRLVMITGNPLLLLISRRMEPIAGLPADTVYRKGDVADCAAMTAAVETAETGAGMPT